MTRPLATAIVLLAATAVTAAPRDEALRIAPADAAVVIVVQNARTHVQELIGSPFARWLPSSTIGKKLLDSAELKQVREATGMIFSELGTSPTNLLEDVFGEAVVFAFTPGNANNGADERSLLIIRPRKLETLTRVIDRINDLQKRTGELKELTRKEYRGAAYFERQKGAGGSDYYGFRGDTFVFSGSEGELKAAFDRVLTDPPTPEKPPELLQRMTALGVADAAGVLLINPRAFDSDVKARVAAAKPDDKRFLSRFSEVWAALDSVAVFVAVEKDVELGVSIRLREKMLPADLKALLIDRPANGAVELMPERTLFGIAGHLRARDLIELIASVAPLEPGKADVKTWIEGALGPIVGRDQLPRVLDALGPNWAVWAEPPMKEDVVPIFVAAVEIQADAATRAGTEKSLLEALEFGFRTARVAYNATHADQIDVKEEKAHRTGAVITTLASQKGFPPGFQPSFAIVHGYLLLASSPEAIRRFDGPASGIARASGPRRPARFSATETRAYLLARGPSLARVLADRGIGSEKALIEQFASLAAALELIDSADLTLRNNELGLQIGIRVTFAKPLK